jgi:hypothetical protein
MDASVALSRPCLLWRIPQQPKILSLTLIEGLPRQRKYKDRANKKENGTTDELLGPRIKIESDWLLYEKPVTCIKKRRVHCASCRTLEQQGREDDAGKGQRLAVDAKSDL